jgi:hypothetical protein
LQPTPERKLSGGISINRIGFVVVKEIQHREKEKDDSENDSGSSSWAPRKSACKEQVSLRRIPAEMGSTNTQQIPAVSS